VSIQAVSFVATGVVREFTPEGGGTWRLTLHGPRGEEPGGIWSSAEVARHLVDLVFDTEPLLESPTGGVE
jgi:hypothetical protein